MNLPFHWTCPFCGRATTIVKEQFSSGQHAFEKNNKEGSLGITTRITVCPSPLCKEYEIKAVLHRVSMQNGSWFPDGKPLTEWALRPSSFARVLPEYVPIPIREDYAESCAIRDLSPKASATLARRCLQGMIRDFWGISKKRLIDEIAELQGKTDPDTWSAIDAVRTIGNIGAHMEKDINIIVDVDPGEAQLLITLIETLIDDWYVERNTRADHLKQILEVAARKDAEKNKKP